MRIAVTRPEEDAGLLGAKIETMGHEVIAAPMMSIRPRRDVTLPELAYQAIAVTSANGIRALARPDRLKSFRILTVGPQSLAAARALGFSAEAHGGNVSGLAAFIRAELDPATGPILYLSGAETTGDLEGQLNAAGFDCRRIVLYDAVPSPTLGQAESAIREGRLDAVLLYSPRTARIWQGLIAAAGLADQTAELRYFCLSRNVAAVLPEGLKVQIAASPGEAALLALLEQIR